MKLNELRLKNKKLYLITNSDIFYNTDNFLDAIASALNGGVQIVQYREKHLGAKKIIVIGKKIRELCSIYNALFIVNDRVDIAKILEADGVHLGQNDIDIKNARNLLGENAIIGMNIHSQEQAKDAEMNGADYIITNFSDIQYLEWLNTNINIPFFIKGNNNYLNNNNIIKNCVNRLAITEGIMYSELPEIAAKKLLEKINN